MNDRDKATIIGYVGTTLRLVDNNNRQEVCKAADELSKISFEDLDSFLYELNSQVKEELEPLIFVLKNPEQLIHNSDVDETQTFILECIGVQAREILEDPPSLFSEEDVSSISSEIQNQRTEEEQQGFNDGINHALRVRRFLRHILTPNHEQLYNTMSRWLPQNSNVRNAAWWLTAGMSFFSRINEFAMDVVAAGPFLAVISLVVGAMYNNDETQQDFRSRERTSSTVNSSRTPFWQNLNNGAPNLNEELSDQVNAHRLI